MRGNYNRTHKFNTTFSLMRRMNVERLLGGMGGGSPPFHFLHEIFWLQLFLPVFVILHEHRMLFKLFI